MLSLRFCRSAPLLALGRQFSLIALETALQPCLTVHSKVRPNQGRSLYFAICAAFAILIASCVGCRVLDLELRFREGTVAGPDVSTNVLTRAPAAALLLP